jgi:hypothetical protein
MQLTDFGQRLNIGYWISLGRQTTEFLQRLDQTQYNLIGYRFALRGLTFSPYNTCWSNAEGKQAIPVCYVKYVTLTITCSGVRESLKGWSYNIHMHSSMSTHLTSAKTSFPPNWKHSILHRSQIPANLSLGVCVVFWTNEAIINLRGTKQFHRLRQILHARPIIFRDT